MSKKPTCCAFPLLWAGEGLATGARLAGAMESGFGLFLKLARHYNQICTQGKFYV